jgi:endonuclease/exonuclease/phosphatase (EEP) superfamily protein YafD
MNEFFRLKVRPWGLLTSASFIAIIGSVGGFFGQYAWWLDIGSHFRVQYVIFLAVMAVCYFTGKKIRWALGALFFAVLNALPVAAFLLPPAEDLPAHGTLLRAMLVNVNTEYGSPERVIASIEKENPDIVVLEEINDRWVKSLAPLYGNYAVQMFETRDDNFGIGLLSRIAAVSTQIVYIGSAEAPSIVAKFMPDNRALTIIGTHPLPPGSSQYSELRNEQLDKLAKTVRATDGPLVLLGDLNVTPWSYYYRRLIRDSGLKNSSEGRGIHPTWPNFPPFMLIPIDHCLHSGEVLIKDKRVGESIGSDHYPVIVDFALSR